MTAWLAWLCGGLGIVAALAWHRMLQRMNAVPAEVKRRAGICPYAVRDALSRKLILVVILILVASASGAAAGDAFGWFLLGLEVPILVYFAVMTWAFYDAMRKATKHTLDEEGPFDPCKYYRLPIARSLIYEHLGLALISLLIALVARHPFTTAMPLAWIVVVLGLRQRLKGLAANDQQQ